MDKIKHFGVGLVIAIIGLLLGYSYITVLTLFTIPAIGKEVYDYFHPEKHTCEFLDALATFLGGLLILISNIKGGENNE